MRKIGLITIHGINNFGSLFQTYATQVAIDNLGYDCEVINYKYPNSYHIAKAKGNSPYASVKMTFWERVRIHFYNKYFAKKNYLKKSQLFSEVRKQLLNESIEFKDIDSIKSNPPQYDIYITGSDQVWNPRYLYEDTTFLLSFAKYKPKIAFSASFGSTSIDDMHRLIMRPLLQEYCAISLRERSGVQILNSISGQRGVCTCDPTLLFDDKFWCGLFKDTPIVSGEYILCYVLSYTANPFPYAYDFIDYISSTLKMKVVVLDENGLFWQNYKYKSYQVYGPKEILNLFKNASFIISSSFHGAAFSVNLKKDFYSIFPKDVKDERQESLLNLVGAADRFIRVGDAFPSKDEIHISNWDQITEKLNEYRINSLVVCKV